MSVLGKRLKEARLRAGMTQEQLGLDAGLEAMSARTRMNRYELGRRTPDFALVERIASVLETPVPYFYAADDEMALLILAIANADAETKRQLLKLVRAERTAGRSST